MRRIVLAMLSMAAWTAWARDVAWTGAASATWDTATANWTDGTSAVAFANGDNATISTGGAISFGANVSPGTATFDIANDLTLTSGTYGFSSGTGALVKRGTGTLVLSGGGQNATTGNRNTCDWHVYGGALKGETAKAFSTFGAFQQPFTVHVHDGGTLWAAAANLTGWGNDGNHENNVKMRVCLHGGTLRSDSLFTLRGLTLDGGTVVQGAAGMSNFGFLKVIERLTVTNAVQTFDYPSGKNNSYWPFVCLGANAPTVFDVADASGDAAADLVFRTPLIRYKDWSGIGWRKAGKGTMLYAPSKYVDNRSLAANAVDGDIHVDEGVLDIGEQEAVSPAFDRTIYVHSNATLRLSRRNALNDGNGVHGDIKTKLVVQGGTLSLSDATSQAAHISLGSLTLDDAAFDYSGLGGFSGGNLGLMTFKALALRGTRAYVFDPANGYPGRSGTSHIHLWDEPLTVIDVADITNGGVDFAVRHRLMDRCTHAATGAEPWGTFVSSGFVKTGPGTMCVDTNTCAFTGDVEVRQGTLRLGLDGTKNGDPGKGSVRWSFLGDLGTNRTITIEAGATLDVAQRNTFGNINSYTNSDVKARFVVRGTLSLTQSGSSTRLPSVEFDDGTFAYPPRGGGVFGLSMFSGTVLFKGTRPYEWLQYGDKYAQFINLSGQPRTTFEVADITGDAAPDLTLGLPLSVPGNAQSNGTVLNGWKFGFAKTGAGTLRYTAGRAKLRPTANAAEIDLSFNGDVAVSNGTLVVDGDMGMSDTVDVSPGAFVGGTGTVHHVMLETGAGFAAASGTGGGLAVTGDLALPASGTVDLCFDGAAASRRMTTLAQVSGTVSAPASFAGWTVLVHGAAPAVPGAYRVILSGKTLKAGFVSGTSLVVR